MNLNKSLTLALSQSVKGGVELFIFFSLLLIFTTSVLANTSQIATNTSLQNDSLTPVSVQINWNHQFQFAGFYAAQMQGYYEKEGLEVSVKSWKSGLSTVEEVLAGRADFATGYSSIISDYAKGAPLKLVMASFQYSPMVLLAHQPVDELSEFSGKSVMHFGNQQIHSLLNKASVVVDQPIKIIPSSGNLQDFIDKKVDFYAAYNTNEPYRLDQQGVIYYRLDPKTYGIQSYGDLIFTNKEFANRFPEKVASFRAATIKGWKYALKHPQEVVDYLMKRYPVVKDRAALLAEAAATTRYVKSGSNRIGQIDALKLLASAADAKENGLITQTELDNINIQNFLFKQASTLYTAEELNYLDTHPVINIGNDRNWEPFEYINEHGEYSGMAADYFGLISKRLGVEFKPFKDKTWAEVMDKVTKGEVEILSCAVASEERKQWLKFTDSYLSFPMVLVASKKLSYIENYNVLNGQNVAVVEGYWSEELLKRDYPKIKPFLVPSIEEGLKAVIDGKAQAYMGNLASINFTIKRFGLDGLHVIGSNIERFDLSIGVSKENPVLFSILDKALKSITPAERNEIYNRWIQLEMVQKTDNSTLIKVVLFALLLGAVLLFIVFIIHRQKQKQKLYIDQINDLSLATYTNLRDLKLKWVSDRFAAMIGYSREELLNKPHTFLKHPDLSDEVVEKLHKLVQSGKSWQGELRGLTKNGEEYFVDVTITPDFTGDEVVGAWTTRVDISDKKRLQRLAINDLLTGVYNRNHFNEVIEVELSRASRNGGSFSIALLDIDFFKGINDSYGHQQGDAVLKQVADVIKNHFNRLNDFVFRVGGEEFVILCDNSKAEDFERHLDELRLAIEALNLPSPTSPKGVLTVSIGALFCESVPESCRANDIYGAVDKGLYQAKQSGRNALVFEVIKKTDCLKHIQKSGGLL